MTNKERILRLVRSKPGLTDAEIRERTGISPHQQVNSICRDLEVEGRIRRTRGPEGLIVNIPHDAHARRVGEHHGEA